MSTNSNWRVVPRTAAMCWLALLAGVLLVVTTIWQMASDGVAILPVVATVAGALLMVVALIGVVAPEKRGR